MKTKTKKINKEEKREAKVCCALFLFLCFFALYENTFARSGKYRNTHEVSVNLRPYFVRASALLSQTSSYLFIVRVKNETIVNSDKLTLGNIAEIFSSDEIVAERLRAISLGYAPNVGAVRELQREKILLAIASAGFSSDEFSFESPYVVRVRRAAQRVESKQMRDAVENAVLNPLKTVGAEAQLTRLDISAGVDVPMGEIEVRASVGTVKDLFSPFSVSIEILVDGRIVKRMSAITQIEATMPVVIAARDIQPNERIKETDVRIETRKLTKPVTNYYRDFSKLRGTDACLPIAKGEVVTNKMVVAGIVVKSGDQLRIIYKSGKMQIVVAGEARASGRIGERIQIKNIQSGNFLQAVIVDEGLVQVN